MIILALNAGSNSLKFEVFDMKAETAQNQYSVPSGRRVVSGVYDDVGKPNASFALLDGKRAVSRDSIEAKDHGHATERLLEWIDSGKARTYGVNGLAAIERIGHRVVHGADLFDRPQFIDDAVVRTIEELAELAPLHNASALRVIHAARAKLGPGFPMVAVFDTVFHRGIPDKAALYAIPPDVAARFKIRRYGFHGISHEYLMLRYAHLVQRSPEELNLITMHLEGGSSIAALRNGRSIDTSMGFTPLEGLMMGTRSGDLDPAIVIHLIEKAKMSAGEVMELLNRRSGLLGVSKASADTRVLKEKLDDPNVGLAVDMFCYRVRKYIGAYMAALGGVDAIVFAGGIGENTPFIRERICEGLQWSGAILDERRNAEAVDCEAPISMPGSRVPIWVVPTEEGLTLAHHVAKCA